MFLIDAFKPKVKKKFKPCFTRRRFRGGESRTYKIKPVLFLFALGLLPATKTLLKKTRIIIMILSYFNVSKPLKTNLINYNSIL